MRSCGQVLGTPDEPNTAVVEQSICVPTATLSLQLAMAITLLRTALVVVVVVEIFRYLAFSFLCTFVPGSEKSIERTFTHVELSFCGTFTPGEQKVQEL